MLAGTPSPPYYIVPFTAKRKALDNPDYEKLKMQWMSYQRRSLDISEMSVEDSNGYSIL